jgi:L-ascorbate metabolism protein UlaG (beta-lactamase superfamily)
MMFEIEYKGGNALVVSTKGANLVFNPKLDHLGLKDLRCSGAVEIASEARLALGDSEAIVSIEGPGEYEVSGIFIKGIPARLHTDSTAETNRSTIYRLEIGETRIGIIGNIDKNLSDDQLEDLGIIDILVLPVGGSGLTLDATDAANVVKSVSPKVVIPVHYYDTQIQYEMPQDSLDVFVKEMKAPLGEVVKFKYKPTVALPEALTIYKLSRA